MDNVVQATTTAPKLSMRAVCFFSILQRFEFAKLASLAAAVICLSSSGSKTDSREAWEGSSTLGRLPAARTMADIMFCLS